MTLVSIFDEKVFNEGLRNILREDAALQAILGRDIAGVPKVYRTNAPPNTEAPYVVYHRVSGEPPQGTFGDDQGVRPLLFDTVPWARSRDEVFMISRTLEEVIRRADWSSRFDPWYVLGRAKTLGDAVEMEDRDSRLYAMACTYQLTLAIH